MSRKGVFLAGPTFVRQFWDKVTSLEEDEASIYHFRTSKVHISSLLSHEKLRTHSMASYLLQPRSCSTRRADRFIQPEPQ